MDQRTKQKNRSTPVFHCPVEQKGKHIVERGEPRTSVTMGPYALMERPSNR